MNFELLSNKEGTDFIKCQRLPHYDRFSDMRLEEVQDQLFFEEVESHRRKTSQNQSMAETDAQIKAIIKDEKELTEKAWPKDASKASMVNHIRDNRKMEKEAIRVEERWELGDNTPSHEQVAAEVIPISRLRDSNDLDRSGGQVEDSIMEILRTQRNERRKE